MGQENYFWLILLRFFFTVIFTALVSWIIIKVIGLIMPIRVTDRAEAIGLDDSEHEETAYPTFLGLDS